MSKENTTSKVGESRAVQNVEEECNISPAMQRAVNQYAYSVQSYEVRDEDGKLIREYNQCSPARSQPSQSSLAQLSGLNVFDSVNSAGSNQTDVLSTRDPDARYLDTVSVTAKGPVKEPIEYGFDYDNTRAPLFETNENGDLRIPLGRGRFSLEVPHESPFRQLERIDGISTLCTESDVGSGVRNTIGGYIALAEEAIRPSSVCAGVSQDQRVEIERLELLGANLLDGSSSMRNIGPNGRTYRVDDVDDVMDAKLCAQRFGIDSCVGASEEGAGVSFTIRR